MPAPRAPHSPRGAGAGAGGDGRLRCSSAALCCRVGTGVVGLLGGKGVLRLPALSAVDLCCLCGLPGPRPPVSGLCRVLRQSAVRREGVPGASCAEISPCTDFKYVAAPWEDKHSLDASLLFVISLFIFSAWQPAGLCPRLQP